jgi:hypothetical protein
MAGAVDFRQELVSFWRAKRSEIGGQFEFALVLGGRSLDLGLETKASPDDSQAEQIGSKCLRNCSCCGGGRGGCSGG